MKRRVVKQQPIETLYETIHFQPGPRVYLYTYDRIFDMRDESWWSVVSPLIGKEVIGWGQNDGLETSFYDGSNDVYVTYGSPYVLQDRMMNLQSRKVPANVRTRIVRRESEDLAMSPDEVWIDSELNDDWMKMLPGYKDELDMFPKQEVSKEDEDENDLEYGASLN